MISNNWRVLALVLVTTTISVLSVIGQTNLPEVDLTINGIRSGSTSRQVGRLGKPQRVKKLGLNECANRFERTFYFSGLEIGVLGSKSGNIGEVYSIVVSSSRWVISPGLKIGDDKKTVIEKFGKPVSDDGETLVYVTKGNLGMVSFDFRNERLVKAEMMETLC